jgi:hypothetical protein
MCSPKSASYCAERTCGPKQLACSTGTSSQESLSFRFLSVNECTIGSETNRTQMHRNSAPVLSAALVTVVDQRNVMSALSARVAHVLTPLVNTATGVFSGDLAQTGVAALLPAVNGLTFENLSSGKATHWKCHFISFCWISRM